MIPEPISKLITDQATGRLRHDWQTTLEDILKALNALTADQTPTTFANLPAASAIYEGITRAVTDSTTAAWGATITGGGTHHVLAYCNGSAWTVAGA